MRQSQLFAKTLKTPPKDELSKNAALLEQAGFIHKNISGVYSYLPLGFRVLKNIMQIIREEMESLGAQEVLLNALQDPELWKKTKRWEDKDLDVWFRTELKTGTQIGLASTHEEPLTDMMSHHINSYKDLPTYVYQFQTKFRNELRAKSGLMRVREFIMKDLYSFSRTEEELEAFYEQCAIAYMRIFDRVGLGDKTYRTFASGGAFSTFSDEFQTVSDAGEDTIYIDEDKNIAINKEVFTDETLQTLGLHKKTLKEKRAIEVGNIFKLGTKFSEALGLTFTDEEGKHKPVIMGSYGIGPGRVMGVIAELYHDEKGLAWPEAVAPFQAHLMCLSSKREAVQARADALYEKLQSFGIGVLYDDRQSATVGEKFKDADLIGIPYRLVLSEKTKDKIECKARTEKEARLIDEEELIGLFKK